MSKPRTPLQVLLGVAGLLVVLAGPAQAAKLYQAACIDELLPKKSTLTARSASIDFTLPGYVWGRRQYEGDVRIGMTQTDGRRLGVRALFVSSDWGTFNPEYSFFETGIGVFTAENGSAYSCHRRPDLCVAYSSYAHKIIDAAETRSGDQAQAAVLECARAMLAEFDEAISRPH